MRIASKSDGTLRADWFEEDGKLHRKVTQPDREQILTRNQEIRKNPGAVDNLSFAGVELNLPLADYYHFLQKYPDLASHDREIKRNAWLKFMGSGEADPYRMRHRKWR